MFISLIVTCNMLEFACEDYPLVCRSGERIIGPPVLMAKSMGNRPQAPCEIYVWDLPHFCSDKAIFEMFSRCGYIYEIRIIFDRFGWNRGIAFVTFVSPKSAKDAVRLFHGKNLFPDRPAIGARFSLGPQLLICGIPSDDSEAAITIFLRNKLKGFKNMLLPPKRYFGGKPENVGHVFVNFDDYNNASEARSKLYDGTIVLWDRTALIEWAVPELLRNQNKCYFSEP